MIKKCNLIIKYKWESGIYNLKDMVDLVLKNVITKEQFFSITRHNFYSAKENELKSQKNYDII